MSLLDNLPHRCQIGRTKRVNDTMGGNRDTFIIEQSNVECWEQQLSSREIHDVEKRGISADRKIYFKADPQVDERHVIIVTHRLGVPVPNPVQYDVMAFTQPDASAGLGVVWRVLANTVTGNFE